MAGASSGAHSGLCTGPSNPAIAVGAAARTRAVAGALVLAVLLALTGAPLAHAVPVDHFTARASAEGLLPAYVHPAAAWYDGRVCIALQSTGYDPVLAAYDPERATWTGPYRIGTNPLWLDSHGAPAVFEDTAGNLHVVYGSHYTRMLHARTAEPGTLDAWIAAPSVDSTGTYPQAIARPGGDVALFFRGEGRRWWMRTSPGGTEAFGARRMILLPDANDAFYAYFAAGSGGRIHAAFVRLDLTETEYERVALARYDAYYMYMDADGAWHNAAGEELPLPITPTVARERCAVYVSPAVAGDDGSPTLETVANLSVGEDESGQPCLLYLHGTGTGDGCYSWRFSRLVEGGARWETVEIGTSDHAYDGGAFAVAPGGDLEAFLTCDASDSPVIPPGRGGGIGRWTSEDDGQTWVLTDAHVSPPDALGRFSAPFVVADAPAVARTAYIEWTEDWTSFFQRAFLWGDSGNVRREMEPQLRRLAGTDRIATAVAVSRESFPEGAEAVFIATSADFPDALAAAPLAHAMSGPLLLSPASGLPASVRGEIERLAPARVVVLGGLAALSEAVAKQAGEAAPGAAVERLGGADRYGTMQAIAQRLAGVVEPHGEALVASGADWPDAVVAGPLAAVLGCPIVLTPPDRLRAESSAVLAAWDAGSCVVVGGPAAISDDVVAWLPAPRRIWGDNRYGTASRLAVYALERGVLPYRAVVVTGQGFPDALAAAPLAARLQGSVLLTSSGALSRETAEYINAAEGLYELQVVGGEAAVDAAVAAAVLQLVE